MYSSRLDKQVHIDRRADTGKQPAPDIFADRKQQVRDSGNDGDNLECRQCPRLFGSIDRNSATGS